MEEDRLLQRAIEESKNEGMPGNPNVDNMTYEQLLELEENNGKVSKGLNPNVIRAIPEKMWMTKHDSTDDQCSICFEKFERRQKIKTLKKCSHEYHSSCIDKWLIEQKKCPMCNEEVL